MGKGGSAADSIHRLKLRGPNEAGIGTAVDSNGTVLQKYESSVLRSFVLPLFSGDLLNKLLVGTLDARKQSCGIIHTPPHPPRPQDSSDIQYIAFQQLSVQKHYHDSFDHISHVMKIETATVAFRDSPQPVVPLELLAVLELNK